MKECNGCNILRSRLRDALEDADEWGGIAMGIAKEWGKCRREIKSLKAKIKRLERKLKRG